MGRWQYIGASDLRSRPIPIPLTAISKGKASMSSPGGPLMRPVLIAAALVALVGLMSPCVAEIPEVLRVSAIPDEIPSELLRIYTPFAEYLQKALGMKVQFTPV